MLINQYIPVARMRSSTATARPFSKFLKRNYMRVDLSKLNTRI